MQVIGRIFKEILIAVILLGIIFLAGFLLFRNQVVFLSSDVPNSVTYTPIEQAEYSTQGDYENQTDPTKTYQNTPGSLKNVEESRRVHTGTPNPFSSALDNDSGTDIPSERVSIANAANAQSSNSSTAQVPTDEEVASAEQVGETDLPVSDDDAVSLE